ncbi:MAG: hypothetical protein UX76_C0008G0025 [Candidatus Wolfebacteria bacterium GW2011_GWC1_47_103]|nr:MAG: hypothetical protein UX76_C0008G0025 [Candidatus Wolfebacteria bacterium GW2011_GWC1_47_103]
MKDFSKDILHTIEERDIAPLPRWIFLMRQTALLGGFVLSVLIGGVSVSVILFALGDIDPGAERMIRMHPGPFLITYLPYVWVLSQSLVQALSRVLLSVAYCILLERGVLPSGDLPM